MTIPALHPDAITAKYTTLKDWRDSRSGRPETLGPWTTVRLDDGTLLVSGRITGPNSAEALRAFADRQTTHLAACTVPEGDLLPVLDVSVPGRVACVWRTGGVWVELWHPDTPTVAPVPTPALREPVPATVITPGSIARAAIPKPPGRLPFGRRLTALIKEK